MSSIAANRSNALAWPNRPVHLVVPTVRDCPDCRPTALKRLGPTGLDREPARRRHQHRCAA